MNARASEVVENNFQRLRRPFQTLWIIPRFRSSQLQLNFLFINQLPRLNQVVRNLCTRFIYVETTYESKAVNRRQTPSD